MDITDPDTGTEPVADTERPSAAERDQFRYVLWSQAAPDRHSRRSGVDRYSARRRNGEAHDLNEAAPAPQQPGLEAVWVPDALTGARKPR